jgi:stress response protein YsnF
MGENDDNENKIEKEKKEDIKRQQNEQDRRQVRVKEYEVPLFNEEKTNSISSTSNNEIPNDTTQKVIPLYAEQLIITKKKVKIGEILITKKKVIEDKKVNIDILKERVTIEYPDGNKERLTEN